MSRFPSRAEPRAPLKFLFSKPCGTVGFRENLNTHLYLLLGFAHLSSSLDCEALEDRDHLTHLCIFRPSRRGARESTLTKYLIHSLRHVSSRGALRLTESDEAKP